MGALRAASKEYRQEAPRRYEPLPGSTRKSGLKRRHFTPEQYDGLRWYQDDKCAICSVDMVGGIGPQSRCADHCHIELKPRGLLCSSCNTVLGVYEKHQRPVGFRVEAYETYLNDPPINAATSGGYVPVVPHRPPRTHYTCTKHLVTYLKTGVCKECSREHRVQCREK